MYLRDERSYFILTFVVCVLLGSARAQSRCTNPNQRSGVCLSVYDCQPLLSVAARNPLHELDRNFLLDSQCSGGFGRKPHVCCTGDTGYSRRQQSEGRAGGSIQFPPYGRGMSPKASSSSSSMRGQLPGPPACGGVTVQNKIYGGDDADLFEFPWLTLLEYGKRSGGRSTNCAGSLINQRYVLTAAHCVVGAIERQVGPLVGVILGEHDVTQSTDCSGSTCANSVVRAGVEQIIAHEAYNEQLAHRHNDIALVRMDRNIIYSDSVRPVCLPSLVAPGEQLRSGISLTVAGWGRTLQSSRSAVKQKLKVPLVDQGQCRQKFQTRKIEIIDAQICAGGVYAEDSCDGDSGGPLMSFRHGVWILEGIVSFGVKCGFDGWPAVHSRVSSYDSWIMERVRV